MAPPFGCASCAKSFASKRGLATHCKNAHPAMTRDGTPHPLSGMHGFWVPRDDPRAPAEGFGFYVHAECGNTWVSAHALCRYRQACAPCRQYTRPAFFWIFAGPAPAGRAGKSKGKPHRASMCEACRLGACSARARQTQ